MKKLITILSLILLTVLTGFAQTTYTNIDGTVSMYVGDGIYIYTEGLSVSANSSVTIDGLATVPNSLTNEGDFTINNNTGSLVSKEHLQVQELRQNFMLKEQFRQIRIINPTLT